MLSYRSVFISDLHLGTPDAKVDELIDFLSHVHCERIYLVGDIVDLWHMRAKGWRWSARARDLLSVLLLRVQEGVEVLYIPGNHDEGLRLLGEGEAFGMRLLPQLVHVGADGRRWLVVHGDGFDAVLQCNPLMRLVGDVGYGLLLRLARLTHGARRMLGLPYWSLAAHVKGRLKRALHHIEQYERAAFTHAREQGFEGIISGHIHHPSLYERDGVTYANCGDWVENCTALVEDAHGRMHLLHWARDHLALLDGPQEDGIETATPQAHLGQPS